MQSNIEKKCKSKGVKLTDQRKIIAKVMSESNDHPNVDELYNRVSKIDEKISIATVYRTVKLFEESGILAKHDFKGGKARYEELNEGHHDHLIDVKTGEIIEFVDNEIEELQKKTNILSIHTPQNKLSIGMINKDFIEKMKSMTGYGSGESVNKGFKIIVELSSVNRKQAEVALSLPSELDSLESDIRKAIFSSVSRGRVSGRVSIQRPNGSVNRSIIINNDQAEIYKKELSNFAKGMNIECNLSLESLLRLPGVMETAEKTINPVIMLPGLKKALNKALKQLQNMRAKEGHYLCKDLTKRLSKLKKITNKVSKHAPKVLNIHKKRLIERLSKAEIGFQDVNDERFLREIVYFSDRSDITEELVRLESHFNQIHGCLTSDAPVGRKLDFLAQEMFREVNTIGSKANDSVISKEVVSLKTELEKIREQVQNVE